MKSAISPILTTYPTTAGTSSQMYIISPPETETTNPQEDYIHVHLVNYVLGIFTATVHTMKRNQTLKTPLTQGKGHSDQHH